MICALRAWSKSLRSASLMGLRPRPGPLNNNSPAWTDSGWFAARLRRRMNRLCLKSAHSNAAPGGAHQSGSEPLANWAGSVNVTFKFDGGLGGVDRQQHRGEGVVTGAQPAKPNGVG